MNLKSVKQKVKCWFGYHVKSEPYRERQRSFVRGFVFYYKCPFCNSEYKIKTGGNLDIGG